MPDLELIRHEDLSLRLMTDSDSDYQLMAGWLTNPCVLKYVEGRDKPLPIDRIKEKYGRRALGLEGVTPCLLIFRGAPIGYFQYYPITPELTGEYAVQEGMNLSGVFAIDQWIGEPKYWNRGLGTRGVLLMLTYLVDVKNATTVMTDPRVDNPRAIRCYEKCGFRQIKVLPRHELHEGEYRDCWLMQIDLKSRGPSCFTA